MPAYFHQAEQWREFYRQRIGIASDEEALTNERSRRIGEK